MIIPFDEQFNSYKFVAKVLKKIKNHLVVKQYQHIRLQIYCSISD